MEFNYIIQGSQLSRVSSVRDLGVLFDFSFKSHIEAVSALLALSEEQYSTSNTAAPLFTYTNHLSYQYLHTVFLSGPLISKLTKVNWKVFNKNSLVIINEIRSYNSPIYHNYDHVYYQFSIPHLRQIHYLHNATFAFKLVHKLVDSSDAIDGFHSRNLPYNLRFPQPYHIQRCISFTVAVVLSVWNLLPHSARSSPFLGTFESAKSSINLIELFRII